MTTSQTVPVNGEKDKNLVDPQPVHIRPRMNHPLSPPHNRLRGAKVPGSTAVHPHLGTSPVIHSSTRLRSQSWGQNHPLGYFPPTSPYTARSVPNSPMAQAKASLVTMPRMPFLPPEHSEQRRAMEAAVTAERKRAKEMEAKEANLTADEMRAVLKRERHRMGRIAADLAALKATAVQAQLEAEVVEEGRINCLMRRMDDLQEEKGRIIVELEREEEMLTNTLQKKLDEVRKEKAKLEKQIDEEKKIHAKLEDQLSGLRDKHISVAEALEEEEEMEEEG